MRVLIAEDDTALAMFLARALGDPGVEVEQAADGNRAVELFCAQPFDLVLLDLQLPGRNGWEVLAAVRERAPLCPVLVLSGAADPATRTACLGHGADDCLPKPFSLAELRARCGALLRRQRLFERMAEASAAALCRATLVFGRLELDRLRRLATVAGVGVALTRLEFGLLEQIVLAGGEPVSRAALGQAVWDGRTGETNALDVHLAALRRKLRVHEGAPGIETVRGLGFRVTQTVAEISAVVKTRGGLASLPLACGQ